MGTWDVDAFSNDDAAGWLDGLVASGDVGEVRRAIERAKRSADDDEGAAMVGIAAAELVAFSTGNQGPSPPEPVVSMLFREPGALRDLVPVAAGVASSIARDGSLLNRMWEGHPAWSAYMVGLQSRLGVVEPVVPSTARKRGKLPPETSRWLKRPSLVYVDKFSADDAAFFRVLPRFERALGIRFGRYNDYEETTYDQDPELVDFWLRVLVRVVERCREIEMVIFPKWASYHMHRWKKELEALGLYDDVEAMLEPLQISAASDDSRDHWVNEFEATGVVRERAQRLGDLDRTTIHYAEALEELVQIIEFRLPYDVSHNHADVSVVAFWRVFCEFAECNPVAASLALNRPRVLAWEREIARDFDQREYFPEVEGIREALVAETADLIERLKGFATTDWSA